MRCAICMARPMPPVSPYVPWPCSGTSTLTELALAAITRLVALRSTTLTASNTIPTGSTTCSSPPPWEVINYEPRNPIESVFFEARPERHINERRHIFDRDKKDRGCIRSRGDRIMGGASHPMQPLDEMLHKHRIQTVRMFIHCHRAPLFAFSRSVARRGCTADSTIIPPMTQALEGAR